MDYSGALICAVPLAWKEGSSNADVGEAIVKIVDARSSALRAMAPAKALRTARSYCNEMRVLKHICPRLQDNGVPVPRVLAVQTSGSIPEMEGPVEGVDISQALDFRSTVVLERLAEPHYVQSAVLNLAASKAALAWLARFHAYGSLIISTKRKALGLWQHGGHTPLPNRPASDLTGLAEGYKGFCKRFESAPPSFRQPSKDLGERLQAVGVKISEWLVNVQDPTLLHGDFKSANIFVKAGLECRSRADDICVIDWQWTGWGAGLQDVLYFFSTSAADECCENLEDSLH